MKKILTKAFRWLFPICAISVSAICIIQGHYALSVWPILAAAFQHIATELMELSEHAVEYGDAMMQDNLKMSQKLCDAELKIVDLQHELTLSHEKIQDLQVRLVAEIEGQKNV